ncbi:hypothetical protein [Bradyrhizobium sp. AZCC 2230]|uniref:hypothetical protein n=1 Tax=Bradyrhizobium sp. AZCC 2230 TaxID=3117021 RepID=UPI002FF13D8B
MDDSPMFIPPRIPIEELAEADQEQARHVDRLLMMLGAYVDRFSAALELIDSSAEHRKIAKQKRDLDRKDPELIKRDPNTPEKVQDAYKAKDNLLSTWQSIDQRDAIMTIWDFAKTVYEIRRSLERCKSLDDKVSKPQLEKVMAGLSKHFPDRKEARDTAAHPADFTSENPNAIEKHKLKTDFTAPGLSTVAGTFLFGATFEDGSVVFSHEGSTVQAKVNRESLDALTSLRDEMYACFKEAAEPAVVKNLKAMTGRDQDESHRR